MSARCPGTAHLPEAPALVVRDLRVLRHGRPALEGVSFTLARGERLAVVGPNGAGKTTLLLALAGLVRPQAGEVRVFGAPPGRHLCLAYLPQRPAVEWNFPATVLDVALMGRVGHAGLFRRLTARDRAKAWEALERVGLAALAHRPIRELSGGEQQRLFLARALAQEAALLLLDEPLTGLDAPAQEGILALLAELARGGITAVVALHELDLVAQHFPLALLLRVRPLAWGPPARAFTPEALRAAYGTALHLLPVPEGTLALGEACCPKEQG
ncbi:MAG: metal ABC transporter ATP-binding protein [Candidatus Bipolaricaulota bacterium]|nr:metal ABC transporter ATP-binding protein [Candidatus Bipolaricaulota bacterium]MCX7844846.1 metal ABC transporter ATP-binding protein [Candidatus Bipolaricaulota bacterium]MDW8151328.1 metal ABC transporter ATP-binding protein [Candidatus Bipolaricaulota bacterium]